MEFRIGWSLKRLGRVFISKFMLRWGKVVVDKLVLSKNYSRGWNSRRLYSSAGPVAIK